MLSSELLGEDESINVLQLNDGCSCHIVSQDKPFENCIQDPSMSFVSKIGRLLGASSAPVELTARSVAKDRLSVILASQRGSDLLQGVDTDALQEEVLSVVQVSGVESVALIVKSLTSSLVETHPHREKRTYSGEKKIKIRFCCFGIVF